MATMSQKTFLNVKETFCIFITLVYVVLSNENECQAIGWTSDDRVLRPQQPISLICISNYINHNVWYEITYPFLNFNGSTVEV